MKFLSGRGAPVGSDSRVVFVFDLGPTRYKATSEPPIEQVERVSCGRRGVYDLSARPFRPNPRWLARAFAHLVRTPRGHCAPLQFLTGGAPNAAHLPRPNAAAPTATTSKNSPP